MTDQDDRLGDRLEIRRCMDRYARGVDRHDRDTTLSVYYLDGLHVQGNYRTLRQSSADLVHARRLVHFIIH